MKVYESQCPFLWSLQIQEKEKEFTENQQANTLIITIKFWAVSFHWYILWVSLHDSPKDKTVDFCTWPWLKKNTAF